MTNGYFDLQASLVAGPHWWKMNTAFICYLQYTGALAFMNHFEQKVLKAKTGHK